MARMISAFQINMLAQASQNSSRYLSRGTKNGIFMWSMTRPSTGMPNQIEMARNVSGAKSATPSFITGQLRPQASVRKLRSMSCWRFSCMRVRCGVV